jgi:hypothetical protein
MKRMNVIENGFVAMSLSAVLVALFVVGVGGTSVFLSGQLAQLDGTIWAALAEIENACMRGFV